MRKLLVAGITSLLWMVPMVNATAAQYGAAASASAGTRNNTGPNDYQSFSDSQPVTRSAASSASETSSTWQAGSATGSSGSSSTGFAGLGVLNLSATASAQLVNVPYSVPMAAGASSAADARFIDSFTVTCAGSATCVAGQSGTMTVAFVLQGQAKGGGQITPNGTLYNGGWDGYAQWAASINLVASSLNPYAPAVFGATSWAGGQTFRDSLSGPSLADYNISYPYATTGIKTLNLDFIFGAPISVDILAKAGASAGVGYDSSGSSAESAFEMAPFRAGWGGILGISTAGGAVVSGVTALSASTGLDYMLDHAAPVPEPDMVLLMALGFATVLMAARRRRR